MRTPPGTTLALLLLVCGTATPQQDKRASFPPRGAQAEKALRRALLSPAGEYMGVAYYSAVLRKHPKTEPFTTIARDALRHAATLRDLCRKYRLSPPPNPYGSKVQPPSSRGESAVHGLDLARRKVKLRFRKVSLLLSRISQSADG